MESFGSDRKVVAVKLMGAVDENTGRGKGPERMPVRYQ
jgi:hypothetical protein